MTCETCKFQRDNRCRRYPPQIYIQTMRDGYQNTWEQETSDWPMVGDKGWCGEYSEANRTVQS
jgi:hypothetical protein